jgi:hypothetical protein
MPLSHAAKAFVHMYVPKYFSSFKQGAKTKLDVSFLSKVFANYT